MAKTNDAAAKKAAMIASIAETLPDTLDAPMSAMADADIAGASASEAQETGKAALAAALIKATHEGLIVKPDGAGKADVGHAFEARYCAFAEATAEAADVPWSKDDKARGVTASHWNAFYNATIAAPDGATFLRYIEQDVAKHRATVKGPVRPMFESLYQVARFVAANGKLPTTGKCKEICAKPVSAGGYATVAQFLQSHRDALVKLTDKGVKIAGETVTFTDPKLVSALDDLLSAIGVANDPTPAEAPAKPAKAKPAAKRTSRK